MTSEAIAADTANMKTTIECLNRDGVVLQSKELTEPNPYPNAQPLYSRIATVNRDGAIQTEDSNGQNFVNNRKLTKEEQEAIHRNVAEQTRRINLDIAKQQERMNQQMENLHKNLQETFGNGFPFKNGSPFTKGFPFGNHFPFNNNPYFPPRNYDYNDYY